MNDDANEVATLRDRLAAAESALKVEQARADRLENELEERLLEEAKRLEAEQAAHAETRGAYETSHASRLHAEKCLERAEAALKVEQEAHAATKAFWADREAHLISDVDRFEDALEVEQEARQRAGITFAQLRDADTKRNAAAFGMCSDWTLADWSNALAGEVGEACNIVKKIRRGDAINPDDLAREIADVVIYSDLLLMSLGIDLGEWVARKFNEVSERRGSEYRLPVAGSGPQGAETSKET